MPPHKPFTSRSENVRRIDRYLRRENASLNSVNGQGYFTNDERVITKSFLTKGF